MALLAFTDYDSIRSILGTSSEEIEDTDLSPNFRYVTLVEKLIDLAPNLANDYITVRALPAPTADQVRFVNLVQSYSAYTVAAELLGALPMFAPKKIKDNSAELDRILDPYTNLRADVSGALDYLRKRLLQAYQVVYPANVAPSTVARRMVSAVGLGVNPVTNA